MQIDILIVSHTWRKNEIESKKKYLTHKQSLLISRCAIYKEEKITILVIRFGTLEKGFKNVYLMGTYA